MRSLSNSRGLNVKIFLFVPKNIDKYVSGDPAHSGLNINYKMMILTVMERIDAMSCFAHFGGVWHVLSTVSSGALTIRRPFDYCSTPPKLIIFNFNFTGRSHSGADPVICEECQECDLLFFDPSCIGCLTLLKNPKTSISQIFAILRQWVPQVKFQIGKKVGQKLVGLISIRARNFSDSPIIWIFWNNLSPFFTVKVILISKLLEKIWPPVYYFFFFLGGGLQKPSPVKQFLKIFAQYAPLPA